MEILIVCVILAVMVQRAATDALWAVRGQTPPRLALKLRRIEARAARVGKPRKRRYGARDYACDLWAEAWQTARARRQARADGRLDRPPGLLRTLAAGWERAWQQASARHAPEQPAPEPVRRPADPPAGGVDHDLVDPLNLAPRLTQPSRPPGDGRDRDLVDPLNLAPRLTPPSRPDTNDAPDKPDAHDTSPEGDSPQSTDTPQTGDDARPRSRTAPQRLAVIIPFRPHPPAPTQPLPPSRPLPPRPDVPEEDTSMSETTGLTTAISYAQEMASAYTANTAHTEQWQASLTGFGVTGRAVEAAAHAMEAQQVAAAAWHNAENALREQIAVREAYTAVPDAGSKEFVTSE